MLEKITHKFSSGLEVTGTIEELEAIAKTLKLKLDYTAIGKIPKGYYPSESRGLSKISEMSPYWLRIALLKRAKDYFAEIYDTEDTREEFLDKFVGLPSDQIVVDLFNEIEKRG